MKQEVINVINIIFHVCIRLSSWIKLEYLYKSLKEIDQYTYGVLQHQMNKPIIWDDGDKEKHDASECCHICGEYITWNNGKTDAKYQTIQLSRQVL